MQSIKLYHIDAFTDTLFSGNPAAVCILENALHEDLMLAIASENNLAETAFVVPRDNDFEIRWFTPTTEVDLCGHATLATAFVLFDIHNYPYPEIRFHSKKSGVLTVSKREGMLYLDFPSDTLVALPEEFNKTIEKCIGLIPTAIFKGKTDFIALIETEEDLINLNIDLNEISRLDARGLIVTSPSVSVDFVSRFFAPQSGINEDPVTGSAHTSLIPLWSGKLGKKRMTAHQLSKRGGQLSCEYNNDRCLIGGKARLYLTGEIHID